MLKYERLVTLCGCSLFWFSALRSRRVPRPVAGFQLLVPHGSTLARELNRVAIVTLIKLKHDTVTHTLLYIF
jgi:hypothetical protein